MELEDFMEAEIAVTAAVTAAIFSPRARKVMRKGMVYGMAGILTTGDVLTAFAKGVRQGMKQTEEAAAPTAQETTNPEMNINPETMTAAQWKAATKTENMGEQSA
ncbi:hypothetical protein [Dictyobacter kobayashii]|uniref:DUF1490 domain-containing protein n=1 Tax=Dictyobacter kobayashii TaxID=2014872 RepID=A0A402AB09_9CHLR|nr:hypothetical protein [Dictyobacter kobayashii]GCE16299.1 hypothetical protein KDK_00990 [Dictyobacter kobayashii]